MKRVLLKISWEALQGDKTHGVDPNSGVQLAKIISEVSALWVELVIVMGGWNIYRWGDLIAYGMNPTDSHNMSMLSTVFNTVSLKNFLQMEWVESEVMDALGVEFLERYRSFTAREYIKNGKIVICSSWTWAPYFSTDTGGVLRALELGCDAMIKMTKVDGVYDSDPMKNTDAKKYDSLSYDDCISQNLKILDQTGIIMARDNALPIYVTRQDDVVSIKSIIEKEIGGTKIC